MVKIVILIISSFDLHEYAEMKRLSHTYYSLFPNDIRFFYIESRKKNRPTYRPFFSSFFCVAPSFHLVSLPWSSSSQRSCSSRGEKAEKRSGEKRILLAIAKNAGARSSSRLDLSLSRPPLKTTLLSLSPSHLTSSPTSASSPGAAPRKEATRSPPRRTSASCPAASTPRCRPRRPGSRSSPGWRRRGCCPLMMMAAAATTARETKTTAAEEDSTRG